MHKVGVALIASDLAVDARNLCSRRQWKLNCKRRALTLRADDIDMTTMRFDVLFDDR